MQTVQKDPVHRLRKYSSGKKWLLEKGINTQKQHNTTINKEKKNPWLYFSLVPNIKLKPAAVWEEYRPCPVYFGEPGAFSGHLGLFNCDPAQC